MNELYFIPKEHFKTARREIDGQEIFSIELTTHYALAANALSREFKVYIDEASATTPKGLQPYIDELITAIGATAQIKLTFINKRFVQAAVNEFFTEVKFLCVRCKNTMNFDGLLDKYLFGRQASLYHGVTLHFDEGASPIEFSVPCLDTEHWKYLKLRRKYQDVHDRADMGSRAVYNALMKLLAVSPADIQPIRQPDFYAVKKIDVEMIITAPLANGAIVSSIFNRVIW